MSAEGDVRGVVKDAGKGTSGGAGIVKARAPVPKLVGEFVWVQWWELGPWANLIMMRAALPYALSGLSPVGAQQTIVAVNMGRAQTIAVAKLTAIMVKLNFSSTIADITATVADDCPECIAKISIELMLMNEMEVLTIVTNTMVENGKMEQAAIVAKAMAEHGHGEFLKMVATKNMPEPLQRAKEGIDGVVGAVKGALPGVGDKDESDSQASVTDQVIAAQEGD